MQFGGLLKNSVKPPRTFESQRRLAKHCYSTKTWSVRLRVIVARSKVTAAIWYLIALVSTAVSVSGAFGSTFSAQNLQDNHPPLVSDLSLQGSGERALMLQNGAVFKGEIQKVNGNWKIELKDNATLIFQNHQVRVVADSIEDIYLFQSQRVSQFDVQQKTALLRWCLKNELLSQAERELSELSRLRLDPRLKKSLEVQVQQLKNPPQADAGLATGISGNNRANSAMPKTQADMPIVLSPSSKIATQQEQSAQTNNVSNLSSDQQRSLPVSTVFKVYDIPGMQNPDSVQDAIDRQLSEKSLQAFSHSTHQIVMEACAACHFQDNQQMRKDVDFQLQIASNQNSIETISFNLKQIMKLLNRNNPGNSELLSIAFQAHGGMKKAPIAEKSLQQQTLVNWVYSTKLNATDAEIDSYIQLAGAEIKDAAKSITSQNHSPLMPKSNSANPYDPAAFNQMETSSKYELSNDAGLSSGISNDQQFGMGQPSLINAEDRNPEPARPTTAEVKSAFDPQVVQNSIHRSLPRPTSMFKLPASRDQLLPALNSSSNENKSGSSVTQNSSDLPAAVRGEAKSSHE